MPGRGACSRTPFTRLTHTLNLHLILTLTLTLTPTPSLSLTLTLTLSLTGPLLLLARLGRVHGAPLLSFQDARLGRGGRWIRVVR